MILLHYASIKSSCMSELVLQVSLTGVRDGGRVAWFLIFLSITGWKQAFLFLTSLTVPSLKACWTATHSRSSTATTIHALWITQSCLAVLPHIAFRTLANFLIVAPATVGTFLVALWIWVFNKGYIMYRTDLFYIWTLLQNLYMSQWFC